MLNRESHNIGSMDITVLVSAPSDQTEAAEAAIEAIAQLNEVLKPHGHSLRSKHWRMNLVTGRGPRGQDVINEQVSDCDAIVAIFGTRLGTDTGKYPSGTVEELFEFIERKKSTAVEFDVHVFFNADQSISPFDINPDELRAVQSFRKTLAEKGIYYSQFASRDSLTRQISTGLSNLIGREKSQLTSAVGLEQFDEVGFDDAIKVYISELDEARHVIEAIGSSMAGTNTALNELNSNHSFTGTSLDRAVEILEASTQELAPYVNALQSHLDMSIANLNLALSIAVEDFSYSTQSTDAKELSRAIEQGVLQMEGFVGALNNAYAALSRLPRLTSRLNRAKRALMATYQLLMDNVVRSANEFKTTRAQWLA